MSNSFYARYVPPRLVEPIQSKLQSELIESVKRRKTDLGAVTVIRAKEGKDRHLIKDDVPENVQGDVKKNKKSSSKKLKKETSNEKLRSSLAFGQETNIVRSEDDKIRKVVPDEILVDEDLKVKKREKKKKKKHPENLPIEAPVPSITPEDSIQKQDIKHQKIWAKREKSILLAKEDSESRPAAKDDFKTGEDEKAASIESHGLVPIPQPDQDLDAEAKTKFHALPDWLAHPTVARVSDAVSLDTLEIHPSTLASLKHKGYRDAFAVQKTILPLLLPGFDQYPGDICISAATGSGKTLAYALPLIENLRDRPSIRLRGLVVVPTRELVAQVRDYLRLCASGFRLQIGTAVGSKSIQEEQDHLVELGQRYDPEAYQAAQEREDGEVGDLMDWDIEILHQRRNEAPSLTNYVDEYTSKVDILICTPGRLVDHMRSTKGFTLDHVQWLVIDEADRLLDDSFQEWIDIIMPALAYQAPPDAIERQLEHTFRVVHERRVRKIILSATMTKDIAKITALQLRRPKLVLLETTQLSQINEEAPVSEEASAGLERDIQLPPTLTEIAVPIVNAEEKPLHLIHLLESNHWSAMGPVDDSRTPNQGPNPFSPAREKATGPIGSEDSSNDFDSRSSDTSSISASKPGHPNLSNLESHSIPGEEILIFASNNENALRLARLLTLLHPSWSPVIHTLTKSSTSASARKTLSSFRTHTLQEKGSILIATDRASRGLDLPRLTHVINYDMPPSLTAYVHRVGRTARAGRDGAATTLVAHHEARWFWNEIARNKRIGRGEGRKVRRVESKHEITDEERLSYAEALKVLGREARGGPREEAAAVDQT